MSIDYVHEDSRMHIDVIYLPDHLKFRKVIHSPYPFEIFKYCLKKKVPSAGEEILYPQILNCCVHFNFDEAVLVAFEEAFANYLKGKKPEDIIKTFIPNERTQRRIQGNFTKDFLQTALG